MNESAQTAIIKDFIGEVQSYIPTLGKNLDLLSQSPDNADALEELHRLAHIVKGAASMVQLLGLSRIADQMEDVLEDIIAGKLEFDDAVAGTMRETIDQFNIYAQHYGTTAMDEHGLISKTILAYRRLRNLPESDDEEAIEANLKDIPLDSSAELFAAMDSVVLDTVEADLDPSMLPIEDADLAEKDEFSADLSEIEDIPLKPDTASATQPQDDLSSLAPELLDGFYEEAEEHLDDLARFFRSLESQVKEPMEMSTDLREVVRQIRRSVHTLKGAAAIVGLKQISEYAHGLEDFLDWLYDEAKTLMPEVVTVLIEGSDLLGDLVSNPTNFEQDRANHIKQRLSALVGAGSAAQGDSQAPASAETKATEQAALTEPDEVPVKPVQEENVGGVHDFRTAAVPRSQTLRVDKERVDDLVNLAGELSISLSGIDQKMIAFLEAINELELSRDRLRDAARDLEVGYEVKAIQHLGNQPPQHRGTKSKSEGGSEFDDFDALELDRYTEFNLIIRTLAESVVDVGALNAQFANLYSEMEGFRTRQRVLLSELQNKIMRVRMTPMSTIATRLHRTVRDVASKLNKKVRLVIENENVELDKMVWEKLSDPLMHLLRNAVDHGIEPPEVRRRMNKPETGTITITGAHEGNQAVIRISDDGGGLNYNAIRDKVRKAELAEDIEELSNADLAAYIFHPGFSTRNKISELSGRGVGLDVVKENLGELKGTVQVDGAKQEGGTSFNLRIPLTLALLRALLFTVNGQSFAVALNDVREIFRVPPEDLIQDPDLAVRMDDAILPVHRLSELLNLQDSEGKLTNDGSEDPLVLVVGNGNHKKALVVDALTSQREIVIKSLGSHLRYVKGISGATIMGDGTLIPILDIEELFDIQIEASVGPREEVALESEKPLEILIVDDSISIRNVLSRMMEQQGWKTRSARDGVEALEVLEHYYPDLILLDIEMPRMNGYEFLSSLRNQRSDLNIPVVVHTSRTAEKHRKKARDLGAQGFVVKPSKEHEFLGLIRSLTGVSAN